MAPRVAFVAALALILHGLCVPAGQAQRGDAEPTDGLPAGGDG